MIINNTRDTSTTASTVTVTQTPAAAPTQNPLALPDADRQTCRAWSAAGKSIQAATAAQAVIPERMTILDPAVRANPEWKAGVLKAAELYEQAADTLGQGIAPGTTSILEQAADAAVPALRLTATGYKTFDEANGNAYHVMKESADTMDALCNRLAPK